jgi:hypothetical protein
MAMWAALGLMAQFTWMQWFLIPARLWRWPIFASALLSWKLGLGSALARKTGIRRIGYWLLSSTSIVAGLFVLAVLVSGHFVVILITPIIPIILGIEMWLGNAFHPPWTYAIGSSLLFGWLIASFFPLG